MKIGIDGRFFGPENKGLGRYTERLLQNLEKIDEDKDRRYYVFLTAIGYDLYQPKNSAKFRKILVDCHWYTWKEQIVFPLILKKYKLDLMHFCHFNVPFFYQKKFIVTIHDLILINYPTERNTTLNKFYYKFKLFAYRIIIRNAIKKSEKIIAVSNFTKNDISKNFRVSSKKIKVIKEGFSIKKMSYQGNENFLKKNNITSSFLLYVGNAYPHKNLERLCLVFKKIKKDFPDTQLVLVGKDDYFYKRLEEFIKKNEIYGIIILKEVNDSQLCLLYQEAEFFMFPSLYEGFGLPPLEALSFSLPVISSNRASLKEVLGEAAIYFNPEDEKLMEEVISGALFSEKFRNSKMVCAPEQLKKFSWRKMTRKTLDLYKNLVSKK